MSEREKDVTGWLAEAAERAADGARYVATQAHGTSFEWEQALRAQADLDARAVLLLPSAVRALADLRAASTDAYKAGRIEAHAFVAAGNVLSEIEALAARAGEAPRG